MIDDHLDELEIQQHLYESKTWDSADGGDGGPLDNIFDGGFNGAARSEMYRAQVAPDLFPHEKPMRVENWDEQDQIMYCGGEYAKAAYLKEAA